MNLVQPNNYQVSSRKHSTIVGKTRIRLPTARVVSGSFIRKKYTENQLKLSIVCSIHIAKIETRLHNKLRYKIVNYPFEVGIRHLLHNMPIRWNLCVTAQLQPYLDVATLSIGPNTTILMRQNLPHLGAFLLPTTG